MHNVFEFLLLFKELALGIDHIRGRYQTAVQVGGLAARLALRRNHRVVHVRTVDRIVLDVRLFSDLFERRIWQVYQVAGRSRWWHHLLEIALSKCGFVCCNIRRQQGRLRSPEVIVASQH